MSLSIVTLISGCMTHYTPAGKYPESTRKSYIDACEEERTANDSMCTCTFEKFEQKMSHIQFFEFSQHMSEDKLNEKEKSVMMEIIMSCVKETNSSQPSTKQNPTPTKTSKI